MKLKDIALVLLALIALLLLWAFIDEKERARKKDELIQKLTKENNNLKQGYLTLLEKYLKTQEKIAPDVISELQKLKSEIDHLETEVHVELDSIIKRVNEGEGTKAVKDLAKIVENKLKQKAQQDMNYNNKRPMLHDLLTHARTCQWINSRQFENGMLLKEIRNRESHELAVIEQPVNIGLAIFSAIDIIYTVSKS